MSVNPTPSAVLFVNQVSRMAEFYKALASMTVIHAAEDHVILEIEGLQLVIHAIPGQDTKECPGPESVSIREDSHLKLCFPVAGIADARVIALKLGGKIGPPEKEWEARGFRACDGHDPEGNVLQVRESASS